MRKWDKVLGISLCIYVVIINIWGGKIAFSGVVFIFGLMLIGFHYIKDKIYNNKRANELFKYFKVLFIIGFSAWILILGAITFYPKQDTSKSDYTIILGAGIRGEELSLTLRQRLDKAIIYFTEYDSNCSIVLSGGQGKDEDITESEAMRRYLVANGIEESRIIKEEKSTNTFENFNYSREVIENHSGKAIEDMNVKVVTSDFHALRSSILAKRIGFGHVTFYTNFTFPTLIPVTYARETFAVVKSVVFDK